MTGILPTPDGDVRFEDDTVTIDGVRLFVRRYLPVPSAGPALSGPWLVFLHEGLGSVAQWSNRLVDVPAWLAGRTGLPALAYDRQGFGRSDPLTAQRRPDYLYDEAWRVLPGLLDGVGLERVRLMGHSDGATIALLFAAAFAHRVDRLAVEAPHVVIEDRTVQGIKATRAAFHEPESRLRAALERFHGEKTAATFSGWADVWLTEAFMKFSILEDLPRITAPLLVLQGSDDEHGTPRQLDAIAARVRGPVETLLLPDCRHVPHFQAADRVLPLLASMLGGHDTLG